MRSATSSSSFTGSPLAPSRQVVFTCRREGVEHDRGRERRGLVFDAAVDDEAVARADLELLLPDFDGEVSRDHVDELVVRVAVARPHPTLLGVMLDQHELRSVREDVTLEA